MMVVVVNGTVCHYRPLLSGNQTTAYVGTTRGMHDNKIQVGAYTIYAL